MQKIAAALALSTTSLSVFAHPGEHHMSLAGMLAHFFSQPDHLALLALVIVGGLALARRLSRKD
ncbi:hypothetical protein [Viridibacterium curvum]|uniref:Uncharacterized protein n=1 Tax=Viridibacterium curvum TaxID=1101404 RepID=A0ABP9QEE7_9RHOO